MFRCLIEFYNFISPQSLKLFWLGHYVPYVVFMFCERLLLYKKLGPKYTSANLQKQPPEVFHKKYLCQSLFFQDEAWNFIEKDTLAQVFFCEFCEIFKINIFAQHLWVTASITWFGGKFVTNFTKYKHFSWALNVKQRYYTLFSLSIV